MNYDVFSEKFDYYASVAKANDLKSVWSIYEVEDLEEKFSESGEAVVVSYEGVEVPVEGDRYLDLYIASDKAIWESGDHHHVYIEGFELKGGKSLVLSLIAGS